MRGTRHWNEKLTEPDTIDDLYRPISTCSKTMAAEAAEQRITQALQKELEKVDKDCMRPLQVRSLCHCAEMLHGVCGQISAITLVQCHATVFLLWIIFLLYFLPIYICRCVLSAAVPVVLKTVSVLLRLLDSVYRGACGRWWRLNSKPSKKCNSYR